MEKGLGSAILSETNSYINTWQTKIDSVPLHIKLLDCLI